MNDSGQKRVFPTGAMRDYGNVYVHRSLIGQSVTQHLEEKGIRVEAIQLEDGNYILEERK